MKEVKHILDTLTITPKIGGGVRQSSNPRTKLAKNKQEEEKEINQRKKRRERKKKNKILENVVVVLRVGLISDVTEDHGRVGSVGSCLGQSFCLQLSVKHILCVT